jgi:hypothetical protein
MLAFWLETNEKAPGLVRADAALLMLPTMAQAQTAPNRGTPEDQKACSGDARRHCRAVLDQGDMAVLACLQQQQRKLTPQMPGGATEAWAVKQIGLRRRHGAWTGLAPSVPGTRHQLQTLARRAAVNAQMETGDRGRSPVLVCVMGPNMVGYHNTRAALVLGHDRSSRSSDRVKTPVRREAALL